MREQPSQHPDKYGYHVPNDCTTQGRNRNDGALPESGYVKCKKCGFTFHTMLHPKGRGEGNTYATPTSFVREGITVYDGADTVVVGGCPFCGTFNYERD